MRMSGQWHNQMRTNVQAQAFLAQGARFSGTASAQVDLFEFFPRDYSTALVVSPMV